MIHLLLAFVFKGDSSYKRHICYIFQEALTIEQMNRYASPINPAVFPHLTIVLLSIGIFFMAWFFVYPFITSLEVLCAKYSHLRLLDLVARDRSGGIRSDRIQSQYFDVYEKSRCKFLKICIYLRKTSKQARENN